MPFEKKTYRLSEINNKYYSSFLKSFTPRSRAAYQNDIGSYLQWIGNDCIIYPPRKVYEFANSKALSGGGNKYTVSHIRSMLLYLVRNDVEGAAERVTKDTLLWLLKTGYRGGDRHE